MQTYLELNEFCKLVHLNEDVVKGMMANGALNFKEEEGKIYIEANQGTFSVVPSTNSKTSIVNSMTLAGESFVEKTIGTILNLHEKVLDAKDETLETLKNENKFLKDALYSMQEIYDEDRKTIETLNAELKHAREEAEFLKRKYKLMWNKTIQMYGSSTPASENTQELEQTQSTQAQVAKSEAQTSQIQTTQTQIQNEAQTAQKQEENQ